MKKLFVLALTGMIAFAVTAQTTAPAAGKASTEKQPVKMESKKEAPAKKDVSGTTAEPVKKEDTKKESTKKETPKTDTKKDASKMDPKKDASKMDPKKEKIKKSNKPIEIEEVK